MMQLSSKVPSPSRRLVLSRSDDRFQLPGRRETLFARQLARGVDRSARIVLIPPAPDGVEVLQTKADRIENLVAVRAHGVRSMKLRALPQGQIFHCLLVLLFQSRNVWRRRRHVFSKHLLEHPYAAFHGAGSIRERSRRQDAGYAQDAAAIRVLQLHLSHLWSSNRFFQTVQCGESAVEESVIAVHEVDHAALSIASIASVHLDSKFEQAY